MSRFAPLAVALTLVTALTSVECQAAPILDASYTTIGSVNYFVSISGSANSLGETFTAVNSGTLNSVALYLRTFSGVGTGTYTIQVTSTSAGAPTTVALASTTFQGSSVALAPAFYSFDLSSSMVALTAGQLYGIVLTANDYSVGVAGANPGAYAGGQMFGNGSGGQLGSATAGDLNFEVFENGPSTGVPEPASIALLAPAALLFIRKRRVRSN